MIDVQGVHGTIRGAVLLLLAASMVIAAIRLFRGPSLADRVVALDLIAVLAAGTLAAYSVVTAQPVILDAAIVISLVGFLATVAFARFLERRATGRGVESQRRVPGTE